MRKSEIKSPLFKKCQDSWVVIYCRHVDTTLKILWLNCELTWSIIWCDTSWFTKNMLKAEKKNKLRSRNNRMRLQSCVMWQNVLTVSQQSDDSWSKRLVGQWCLISTCASKLPKWLTSFSEHDLREGWRWQASHPICFNETLQGMKIDPYIYTAHCLAWQFVNFSFFSGRHNILDQYWEEVLKPKWPPYSHNPKKVNVYCIRMSVLSLMTERPESLLCFVVSL